MNTKSINDKIALYPILNDVKQALILKNVSDRTVTNYMDGIARFLDFIKYDNLFEITEDHFRNYLFYLHSCNFSKITINTYNSFIRFFFNAVLNTAINPYRVPMAKFIPKDIDFLFDHQISSLLSVSFHDSRLDCIIKLALCCGLRINEVISLKVSDISTKDRSNMTVYIRESKKNRSRFVPLDKMAYRAIQRYAKEYRICPNSNRYFFVFSRLSHTCNETIRRHFNLCRDAAGIPRSFTFHCLRHTYAVNFLRAGGNLLDLKYRLGHSSLASTSRYLHFARNMMNTDISYMDKFFKEGV
ncbi:MAG: tyrosine-type recombinase/integrase [Thomasclavelia spiroformis]